MQINSKITTLIKALYGVLLKVKYGFINVGGSRLIDETSAGEKVTVSLTSYGRRVRSTLPYVLISLLRQTRRPNRIVVWLDNSWNDNILPQKLIRFKNIGVEFKYCEDYKSYKKLIPSLLAYPDDIIITCDDDLFYKKNMVERLLQAHQKHPNTICCQLAHGVCSSNRELLPYNEWEEEIFDKDCDVFPLGGAGCLYKKEFLYEDVVNYELASTLAPKADDVWFFFMGVLNKTKRYVLPYQSNCVTPLDAFYQFFHRGSSLMEENLTMNMNDKQIKSVMDYYSIEISNTR